MATQEEDEKLTKSIAEVQGLLNVAMEEYADKEDEHERELEALRTHKRVLTREHQLANLMIDNTIPKNYLKKIESNMTWNKELKEFELKRIAFAGNNLPKPQEDYTDNRPTVSFETKQVYGQYSAKKKDKKEKKEEGVIAAKKSVSLPALPGPSCSKNR